MSPVQGENESEVMLMIELKLTGPCKDCLHFELCTDTTNYYADGVVVQRTVTVSCGHEQVCGKRQAEFEMEGVSKHGKQHADL